MTPQELIDELYDAVDFDDMYSRSYLVYAVEDLCAENAKLRELVRDIWAMRTPQIDFETYTAFRDRMRELGVEK